LPGGKLGLGLVIVASFAVLAVFADFFSPYDYRAQSRSEPSAPATRIHFRDPQGNWHLRPLIYDRRLVDSLTRTYVDDKENIGHLAFFARGDSYRLFGLIETNLHLFGVRAKDRQTAPKLNLLGTDELGRDRFSRLLAAARFSLSATPLSVLLASALGVIVGCIAGYSGRWLGGLLMRAADLVIAMPTLVVVLAARAAFPLELPPVRAGALIVGIFVAVGWAEMARLTRGQVIAMKHQEFVVAARSLGMNSPRILIRHILPNIRGSLVVQMTLMLAAFLLTETALSFLGVGLQEPEPSWGNMLSGATNLTALNAQPFALLSPALAIFLFVLGVRLVSDGLRLRFGDRN
jgi:peptide/nickel transport system permease protein